MKRLLILLVSLPLFAENYSGSAKCGSCHTEIYGRWKKTRMANVIQDVKAHPEAILGDFTTPNPLVTFTKDEIAFTYGSRWKQRYFTKRGKDYFVFPAQWDVQAKVWRKYSPAKGQDWWADHYPADQMSRPTGPLCDGCHSVHYDIQTQTVSEWNVGCEKCHGAGAAHSADPKKDNIINPAKLDDVRSNDLCIQCHSQGQPISNPVNGRYYDWPYTFVAGMKLSDHWKLDEGKLDEGKLDEGKPGETTFTHFADGTAHKNRMQGNDFVQSKMFHKGVRCSNCHDAHGTGDPGEVIVTGNDLCLNCHGPETPNGPKGTLEQHTGHKATSTGSQCVACHMPQIAQTIANVNVRSHTFKFVTPSTSERLKIPNACVECHKDKTNGWADVELKRIVSGRPTK